MEKKRADELFDILNELHQAEAPSPQPQEADADSPAQGEAEIGSHVDELLSILGQGSEEDTQNDSPDTQDGSLEDEVPVSLFQHLSDEGSEDADSAITAAGGIHVISPAAHFTDETTPAPPLPAEEQEAPEEELADNEELVSNSFLSKLGRFFKGASFIPKALIYVLIVVILSAYLAYFIISIGNDVFALVTDSVEITVTLPENADNEIVADILEKEGLIEYGWVYELYMDYRSDGDSEDVYIAGDHILNTDMNYSQLIHNLTIGNNTREIVRVTIPEGYTVDQIIALLLENGVGQRDDYIEAINNYPYKWDFVQQLDAMGYSENRKYRLEGYLYPDTYEFYTDEDEVYVINKLLAAFNDKFWEDFVELDEEGSSYQLRMQEEKGLSFDDVVVLASMIQSEGGSARDFYFISYVFHNRLSHSAAYPKLESDATIQYTLPERLTTEELGDPRSYETPYNTYLYDGLPPGAISSPGLEALSATLFPEAPLDEEDDEIDAFYFVSNDKGKTYYAATEGGHERNKEQVKKDNESIEAGDYEG